MGGDDGPKKIKVVDRRWFTDDGRPREGLGASKATAKGDDAPDGDEAVDSAASSPSAPKTEAGQEGVSSRGEVGSAPRTSRLPKEITMLHLIDFLAQQAVILLSGAHGVPKDPEQARLFIDFLGVLDTATRGNLTAEEAALLSDVLFQLRTLFVQSSQ